MLPFTFQRLDCVLYAHLVYVFEWYLALDRICFLESACVLSLSLHICNSPLSAPQPQGLQKVIDLGPEDHLGEKQVDIGFPVLPSVACVPFPNLHCFQLFDSTISMIVLPSEGRTLFTVRYESVSADLPLSKQLGCGAHVLILW